MKTPDEEVLKAMVNLEPNVNWRVLQRWFRDSLTEAFAMAPDMRTGMAYQVNDLLVHIENARMNLESLRRK